MLYGTPSEAVSLEMIRSLPKHNRSDPSLSFEGIDGMISALRLYTVFPLAAMRESPSHDERRGNIIKKGFLQRDTVQTGQQQKISLPHLVHSTNC